MASILKISAADHPIKSVTVFKSFKAEVVRTFSLDLKAGQNKVDITDLPSAIDTQSVRVSGLGEARLLDVVCTVGNNKAAVPSEDSPAEIIRILNLKKAALKKQQEILEQESNLLVTYAETLKGEHINPTQMTTFLDSFVDRGKKNLVAIDEIQEQIVEVEREIEKETARKNMKKGETDGEVSVVVVAQEDGDVELRLTYIVTNVSWEPTYELHATTENGKPSSSVSLHYRGRITQSTGEAWTNIALTLSTVTSENKSIPTLVSTYLQPHAQKKAGFTNPFQNNAGFANPFPNNAVGTFADKSNMLQQQLQQYQQVQQQSFQQFQQQPPPPQQQQQQQAAPPGIFTQPGGLFGPRPVPATNAFGAAPQQGALFGQAPANAFGAAPQPSTGGALFGSTRDQSEPSAAAPTNTGFRAAYTSSPYLGGNSGGFGLFGSTAPVIPPTVEAEETEGFEEVGVPGVFTEPATVVGESPLALTYSVEGESTIASDGIPHQVSIAVLPFEAKVTHVTVPCIEAVAYLQCVVKNTSDYRLLPGSVTVILDDSYVSKTHINDINKGDTFNCTLGADSSARIIYTRTSKTTKVSAGTFAEVMNTTTYTTYITVENKHQFPISELIVRDLVPLSTDKRLKVILRKPEGLADAKDGERVDLEQEGLKTGWCKLISGKGGEKEGKFEWTWKVDAGKKVCFHSEFEVKGPADLHWTLPTPFDGRLTQFGGRSKFCIM